MTASHHHFPLRHFLLALAVVFVWGTNFVIIKVGLHELPPLLFASLRFVFAFFPLIFFIKRPPVPWGNLAFYGFAAGAQFGILFLAMRNDITPGLASLVVQAQVFMTIGMSMLLTGERMKLYQIPALLLAIAGIVVIGVHTDASTTVLGLLMVLGAALSWSIANTVSRRIGRDVNMLGYVVWSSPFAAIALGLLAFAVEGWPAMEEGLRSASLAAWGAVVWQSVGNVLFGYAVWAWLLSRYPASTISPMALLVPVFGMSASTLLLDEPMPVWKIIAALMVMGGLALNILWPRMMARLRLARER